MYLVLKLENGLMPKARLNFCSYFFFRTSPELVWLLTLLLTREQKPLYLPQTWLDCLAGVRKYLERASPEDYLSEPRHHLSLLVCGAGWPARCWDDVRNARARVGNRGSVGQD